jgi:hypothetical protein
MEVSGGVIGCRGLKGVPIVRVSDEDFPGELVHDLYE